jgi:hypothetical protein
LAAAFFVWAEEVAMEAFYPWEPLPERRKGQPWSEAVSRQILRRVAEGESLRTVCRDAEMPAYEHVEPHWKTGRLVRRSRGPWEPLLEDLRGMSVVIPWDGVEGCEPDPDPDAEGED